MIPIPGDGSQIIRPTHIDDVINAIKSVMMNEEHFQKIRLVVGTPISLSEFIENASQILHHKAKISHIPLVILKPLVRVYQLVSKNPALTLEQLKNLNRGSVMNIEKSDFPSLPLEDAIKKTCQESSQEN